MRHLRTKIALPPGLLSNTSVREVLRLVFEEFRWFPPVRYPKPMDAETQAGKARERETISLLGPECFYDHERHTLPTRRPKLMFPPPQA